MAQWTEAQETNPVVSIEREAQGIRRRLHALYSITSRQIDRMFNALRFSRNDGPVISNNTTELISLQNSLAETNRTLTLQSYDLDDTIPSIYASYGDTTLFLPITDELPSRESSLLPTIKQGQAREFLYKKVMSNPEGPINLASINSVQSRIVEFMDGSPVIRTHIGVTKGENPQSHINFETSELPELFLVKPRKRDGGDKNGKPLNAGTAGELAGCNLGVHIYHPEEFTSQPIFDITGEKRTLAYGELHWQFPTFRGRDVSTHDLVSIQMVLTLDGKWAGSGRAIIPPQQNIDRLKTEREQIENALKTWPFLATTELNNGTDTHPSVKDTLVNFLTDEQNKEVKAAILSGNIATIERVVPGDLKELLGEDSGVYSRHAKMIPLAMINLSLGAFLNARGVRFLVVQVNDLINKIYTNNFEGGITHIHSHTEKLSTGEDDTVHTLLLDLNAIEKYLSDNQHEDQGRRHNFAQAMRSHYESIKASNELVPTA